MDVQVREFQSLKSDLDVTTAKCILNMPINAQIEHFDEEGLKELFEAALEKAREPGSKRDVMSVHEAYQVLKAAKRGQPIKKKKKKKKEESDDED